jgi:hypothetical protein
MGRFVGRAQAAVTVLALVLVVALTGTACSRATDTTSVDAAGGDAPSASINAPTSSIVRSELPTTTTATSQGANAALGGAALGTGDLTSSLTGLLGQFVATPGLVDQLGNVDAIGAANLLGVDLSVLQQLDLSPLQLQQLARSVLSSSPQVQQQLLSGSIDPAVLLGLLGDGLDLETLTNGAVAAIVQGLLGSIGDLDLILSPELSVNLGELLGELDLEGLEPLAVNPANASLIALVTSAWLGSNPLLAQQLLGSPLLDPVLKELLQQLSDLSDSIGETARQALLEALYELIPALDPDR